MKIVSVAPILPFSEIANAGGHYYFKHLSILSRRHDVTVVVPGTIRNLEVSRSDTYSWSVLTVPLRKGRNSLMRKLAKELRPTSAPRELFTAFRNDPEVQDLIASADVLEFQWSEYASLIRVCKQINKRALVTAIVHDVLVQKYLRRVRSYRGLRWGLRAGIALLSSSLLERVRLRRADAIVVFSDKDRSLLVARGGDPKVQVLHPPMEVTSGEYLPMYGRVLFVGAMDRPENDFAALWLIREVWPVVNSGCPSATLEIVGANPSDELLAAAAKATNASVTGFVKEIEVVYLRAAVFVAPLFQGAGVKFKTITAMLHGVPVIATPIGAEGIGSERMFACITTDPKAFGEGVISVLTEVKEYRQVAQLAQTWARSTYSESEYERNVERILINRACSLGDGQ